MSRQGLLFTEIPHLEQCPEDPYPFSDSDYLYQTWQERERIEESLAGRLAKPVVELALKEVVEEGWELRKVA